MSEQTNRMLTLVNMSRKLPIGVRQTLLSKAFGLIVPMVGTAGIKYEEVTAEKVIVSLKNKRSMQNHIHGVHAVAAALLAETATGFVTSLSVPDDRILLIKSLHLDYKKVMKGDMKAIATLDLAQREYISKNPKGELSIPVKLIDESGEEPIQATMIWAWLPKKKSA